MDINIHYSYWAIHGFLFCLMNLFISFMLIRIFLFMFKLLNKKLNLKNVLDLSLTANFYIATMFIEQFKTRHKSSSLLGFTFSFTYIGIWLWNRLFSGFMQTEAFRIDVSKIINKVEHTLKSDMKACLLFNEPLTYEFLDAKKKIFPFMFPNKPRHLYRAEINDILDLMRNYKTNIFISSSIFIKSVSWSVCSYFKVSFSLHPINSTMFTKQVSLTSIYFRMN